MDQYIRLTRRLPIARIRHVMCCNSLEYARHRSFNTRQISLCVCSPCPAPAERTGRLVGLFYRTFDTRQAFSTLSVISTEILHNSTPHGVAEGSLMHKGITLLNVCDGTTVYTSIQVRKKSSKGKSRTKVVADEDLEDDDDESDEESDNESDNIFFEEDRDFPLNYRDIKVYLKSLRLDGVVSSGLNIARNKVDEYFLGSKLRVNGVKVLKKSKQMNVGDHVDLVASNDNDKLKVKRVRIVKVESEKSNKDKLSVHLRVWRNNVLIEDPDKFQPFIHGRS